MYTLGESDFEHQLPKQFQSVPVTFNHVNQVVRCRPGLADRNVGVTDFIFTAYGVDFFVINICQRHRVRDG